MQVMVLGGYTVVQAGCASGLNLVLLLVAGSVLAWIMQVLVLLFCWFWTVIMLRQFVSQSCIGLQENESCVRF